VSDAASKIAEIEARRNARKAALSSDREEQFAKDLEALDALEVEHGDGVVARLDVDHFVKGHPTFVVVRAPTGIQYKRFADMVTRAGEQATKRREATDMLAQSCWLYPDEAQRKEMLEHFPGLLPAISLRAMQLAEAKAADEGKG